MSTIEERIADIRSRQFHIAFGATQADYDALATVAATITEPWNAALEAMKAIVGARIDIAIDGTAMCLECLSFNSHHQNCPVAAIVAAIALMEGDLTPDETVVELSL